ncbi:ORF6N domain-containing protein [Patescibacteria group bacterium]
MNKIYEIRGKKVMLDEDLARIYGIETKVLNQAVKRNRKRFPEEFMFLLTEEKFRNLRSHIVISSCSQTKEHPISKPEILRSQIVTSNRGGRKYKPFAFTEHGTVMLATVLRSNRAVQMSIEVVKAFVELRRAISSQEDILRQLSNVRTFILQNSTKTKMEIRKIWKTLDELTELKDESSNKIGFTIESDD